MADPLATLARLRRLDVEAATRDLAAALATERDAEAAATAAAQALRREASFTPTDAAHPLASRYALWLPTGRAQLATALQTRHAAAARVAICQQSLATARAAERAVETMLQTRRETARLHRLKRDQAAADDRVRTR